MPALFIITGTTRGLGAAFARLASEAAHRVIGLSRRQAAHGETLITDLADISSLTGQIKSALSPEAIKSADRCVLINSAAVIAPIGGHADPEALDSHFRINLTAPIVLARAFVESLANVDKPKRVINLSSGASTTAFRGWSAYCASKAGLDHFGRCLALEQQDAAYPVDVLSFSPGVVDTDMQASIRASDPHDFPDRPRFIDLHANAQLASAESVAAVMLAAAVSKRRYAGAVLRTGDLP